MGSRTQLPAGDLREAEGAAGSTAEDGLINLKIRSKQGDTPKTKKTMCFKCL